jgi:hypothetical protein
MFRRRRPLLRAAALGGAAYYAGKKAEEGQDPDTAEATAASGPEPSDEAPSDGAISDGEIEQLKKVSELKQEGILTQDEFEAQKQKILGS